MSSEGKTEVTFVRKTSRLEKTAVEFIILPYAVVGGVFLALIVFAGFPELNIAVSLAVWFFFPILFTILVASRNRILEWFFNKASHQSYLELAIFMKNYPFFSVAGAFVIGINAFREPMALFVALSFLFLSLPLYYIFERPLTGEGRVQILFDGLFESLDNFTRRQYYWEKISEMIEKRLKVGNIKVMSSDLIHQFNKTLLETPKDVSNDLRNIQAWMLGRQRTCFDSIKGIYPEIKFEPYTKESYLKHTFENLTSVQANLIKFLSSLAVIAILSIVVILMRPELANEALGLIQRFLGIQ
jgi:hypothetical protein